MEEKLIIKKLREDRRNEIYTNRGINPIFQLNPKSKILIIGQAPGERVEERAFERTFPLYSFSVRS